MSESDSRNSTQNSTFPVSLNANVMIVAAEASSSLYAQRILEQWKQQGRVVSAFGIGSQAMQDLGFERLGKSEELAVVGLQEVIKHFPLIRQTYKSLLAEAERRRPKFALLLDYPDFNLRLAKDLKALGITVIYYISPQVWAWRTGRVKKIKKVVDRMLVLFPFEKDFYQKHGVPVDFVGHPLLDEVASKFDATKKDKNLLARQELRQRYGILNQDLVLGLMPGSRHSEINHHFDVMMKTAKIVCEQYPNVKPVLFVAPSLKVDDFKNRVSEFQVDLRIIQREPFDMIEMADLILCASGTATLMVGLMEKPMVIMYRMNAITAFLAKRLVTATQFFGMVNLIMGRQIVPELFQEQTEPNNMAKHLGEIVSNEVHREEMIRSLQDLKNRLGSRGATGRVVEILNSYLS